MRTLKEFLEAPGIAKQLVEQGQTIDFEALEAGLHEVSGWKSERPLFVPSGSLSPVSDALAAAHAEITQLKFLLASAPMIDAPKPLDAAGWFRRSVTSFGYIHPRTMAQYRSSTGSILHGFMILPGSPTKWILTSLMPEGRVIFSPLAIPGLEKILAD